MHIVNPIWLKKREYYMFVCLGIETPVERATRN